MVLPFIQDSIAWSLGWVYKAKSTIHGHIRRGLMHLWEDATLEVERTDRPEISFCSESCIYKAPLWAVWWIRRRGVFDLGSSQIWIGNRNVWRRCGLTRTARFKFCKADSLQNKTRTDQITTDMERRRFISYVRVSFSLNTTSRKVDWAFQQWTYRSEYVSENWTTRSGIMLKQLLGLKDICDVFQVSISVILDWGRTQSEPLFSGSCHIDAMKAFL